MLIESISRSLNSTEVYDSSQLQFLCVLGEFYVEPMMKENIMQSLNNGSDGLHGAVESALDF